MTPPAVSPLAEQIYSALWPLAGDDEIQGWALLLLVGLCAQPFAEVDELVGDTDDGPGWSILFDLDRCPGKWLDFPAAAIGARPAEGLDDDQRRTQIRDAGGVQRGTPDALKAVAALHLSGSKNVSLIERDGGAWRDTLITYTAQTPDAAAVNAAIQDPTVKPAGRKITHRVDPGWTVGQFEDAYAGRTVADMEAAFATVGDFESNLPI